MCLLKSSPVLRCFCWFQLNRCSFIRAVQLFVALFSSTLDSNKMMTVRLKC